MSNVTHAELWSGYQGEQPLELGELVLCQVISLQTDAPTKLPNTILEIATPGVQPCVVMEKEDGLNIGPPAVKLVGTCTRDAWLDRGDGWPEPLSRGLIVPRQHLVFEAKGEPRYLRSGVVGWMLLGVKDRSVQSRSRRN